MRPKGRWKSVVGLELAVAGYVDCFNHRHGELGQLPPAEFETHHWATEALSNYVETPVPAGQVPSN